MHECAWTASKLPCVRLVGSLTVRSCKCISYIRLLLCAVVGCAENIMHMQACACWHKHASVNLGGYIGTRTQQVRTHFLQQLEQPRASAPTVGLLCSAQQVCSQTGGPVHRGTEGAAIRGTGQGSDDGSGPRARAGAVPEDAGRSIWRATPAEYAAADTST